MKITITLLIAALIAALVESNWRVRNAIFHPSYGWCGKCKKTWDIVEGHLTQFDNSHSCFPLCEKCWSDLKTPEARLHYYRELVNNWKMSDSPKDHAEDNWAGIKEAVLAGK